MNWEDAMRVADRLLKSTKERTTKWEAYPPSDDEYKTNTDRFMFYVGSKDDDRQAPYRLQVYARKGDGKYTLISEYVTSSSEPDALEVLKALVELARTSSVGLHAPIVDEVLKDLDNLAF